MNTASVKAVKVSLISAGQVQTNKNSGFDIKEIVGIYNSSSNTVAAGSKEISTAKVTWENVNPTMSNFMTLDADVATNANGLKITPKTAGNTFDYQVPVFPYTGDAVIREFDTNQKIVAYYLAPTVKDTADKVNTNIIKAGARAYEATAEEATNHAVGTIKTDGNNVIVNSSAVGSTNLKGTISLPSLGGEVIDASNRNVYTSVQWNPLPKDAEVSTSDAFLALAGQNVTVYAQLSDKNGNPVSLANQTISYTVNNTNTGAKTSFTSTDNLKSLNGTAVLKNTSTDVNGRATLVLNNAQANVIDDLKATAGNYDVILYIGEDKASTADIYWVNADLGFKKSVTDADYERTNNDTAKIETNIPKVSTPWQYAVKTVGNIFEDDADTSVGTHYKKFKNPGVLEGYDISIDGLTINTTFDEENKGTYEVVGNGVVNATSKVEETDVIVNALDESSVGSNVTFTAKKGTVEKTYKCVGEGSANLTAKMKLNVAWEAQGTKISNITPLGTNIGKEDTELYVRVTDETGENVKTGKTVTFKSGNANDVMINATGTTGGDISGTGSIDVVTDDNGIAKIKLVKNASIPSSVISATVDIAKDEVTSTTINWVNDITDEFRAVNATMKAGSSKELELTFNNRVLKDSVNKAEFVVYGADSNQNPVYYEVTDAQVSGKTITLTLGSDLPAGQYFVDFTTKTVKGVTYELADETGKTITKKNELLNNDATGSGYGLLTNAKPYELTFYSTKKASFEGKYDSNQIKLTNIIAPVTLKDGESYGYYTVDGVVSGTIDSTENTTAGTAKSSGTIRSAGDTAEHKVVVYLFGTAESYTIKEDTTAADTLATDQGKAKADMVTVADALIGQGLTAATQSITNGPTSNGTSFTVTKVSDEGSVLSVGGTYTLTPALSSSTAGKKAVYKVVASNGTATSTKAITKYYQITVSADYTSYSIADITSGFETAKTTLANATIELPTVSNTGAVTYDTITGYTGTPTVTAVDTVMTNATTAPTSGLTKDEYDVVKVTYTSDVYGSDVTRNVYYHAVAKSTTAVGFVDAQDALDAFDFTLPANQPSVTFGDGATVTYATVGGYTPTYNVLTNNGVLATDGSSNLGASVSTVGTGEYDIIEVTYTLGSSDVSRTVTYVVTAVDSANGATATDVEFTLQAK